MSGGRIQAASEGPNTGSTFTVLLPRPLDTRRAEPADSGGTPHAAWERLDGRSVLLVDDDDDTRRVLGALLQTYGAQVTTAASAEDARRALTRRVPDVVVTDLAMPGEDRYSVLHFCRNHANVNVRELPVIALTAYAGEQARARILDAGFNEHLTKPIDPASVSRAIAELSATPRLKP